LAHIGRPDTDIDDLQHLQRHPMIGASWEGFMVEAIIQRLGARTDQCYFWATHTGAETFPLSASVRALAARRLLQDIAPLTRARSGRTTGP
jgi:hypothetical protein